MTALTWPTTYAINEETFSAYNTSKGGLDGSGNLVLAGQFYGSLNFGGRSFQSSSNMDADGFAGKVSPQGQVAWAVNLAGAGYSSAYGMHVDSRGDVLITGMFDGTITVGGRQMTAVGKQDVFVVKLSGSNGAVVWTRTFGGPEDDWAYAVTANPAGDVFTTGIPGAGLMIDGKDITGAGFVARLGAADGAIRWVTGSDVRPYGVTVASTGDVLLAGDDKLVKLMP